ncbi:IS110 family transposase [Streptomyces goshikiensis]|uniref:IS110 family transposase n=1 Tax=Streptomyces goshikiensis TaxID=1942 RepID=UPI003F4D4E5A
MGPDRRPPTDRGPYRELPGCPAAPTLDATDRRSVSGDPYPGEAKTDAKYAAAIADAARTTPRPPHSREPTAELTAPSGFGQNLAAEPTRTGNRIRNPLTLPWTRN